MEQSMVQLRLAKILVPEELWEPSCRSAFQVADIVLAILLPWAILGPIGSGMVHSIVHPKLYWLYK